MGLIRALTFAGALLGLLAASVPVPAARADDEAEAFAVTSNLRAGVAKLEITPPPDTPVIGHPRPTKGARDPIRAGVLLLDDGKTKAAIATFDLISASDALVKAAREARIEVHAMHPGDMAEWLDPFPARLDPKPILDWVDGALKTGLFDGIHLDIEPHGTPAWKTASSCGGGAAGASFVRVGRATAATVAGRVESVPDGFVSSS